MEPIIYSASVWLGMAVACLVFTIYACACWKAVAPVHLDLSREMQYQSRIHAAKRRKLEETESRISNLQQQQASFTKLRSERCCYAVHPPVVAPEQTITASDAAVAMGASPERNNTASTISRIVALDRAKSALTIPLLTDPSAENRWRVYAGRDELRGEGVSVSDIQQQYSVRAASARRQRETELSPARALVLQSEDGDERGGNMYYARALADSIDCENHIFGRATLQPSSRARLEESQRRDRGPRPNTSLHGVLSSFIVDVPPPLVSTSEYSDTIDHLVTPIVAPPSPPRGSLASQYSP